MTSVLVQSVAGMSLSCLFDVKFEEEFDCKLRVMGTECGGKREFEFLFTRRFVCR